jgi:hypothetical protein
MALIIPVMAQLGLNTSADAVCSISFAQATGYLGAGTAEDDASSLTGMGGNLVQLTPESIKDLGSEQIYKAGHWHASYFKSLPPMLKESLLQCLLRSTKCM